ncbi:LPXTG cell wall anchor domain-containing protein [Eubacterium ventriosum]|uniref:LPXTG cell wall anchor domain-containing protein n=1 Tax=Eubacterium ventriosum TaxID=39496 RepID=UPI002E7715BF|nr:LPXTG cell wall anchor domain-containing protein [Eubacterium ventriosum]MEE0854059.1 LPXTG cell wall anchor domain-containing protein [Eubacterium ventriosum]
MRKKLLAVIAAAAMAVTMMPAMVFAAGTPVTTYEGLKAAVENGGEVTLENNIALEAPLQISKNVILNLGDYDITPAEGFTGDNAVKDSLIVVNRGAHLTVNGNEGTIDASDNNDEVRAGIKMTKNDDDALNENMIAKLTVNGGIIKGDDYGIVGNGNRHGTEIIINGGKVESDAYAIYHPQDGILTVNNGTIIGQTTGIEIRSGNLNINGGVIIGNGESFSVGSNGNGTTTSGAAVAIAQHTTGKEINVNITGGTFEATADDGYAIVASNPQGNNDVEEKVKITVNGGVFDGIVADNTAPGSDTPAIEDLGATLLINKGILKKGYSIAGEHSGFSDAEDVVDVDYITYVGNDLVADALKNATKDSEIYVYNDVDGMLVVPAGAKVYNFTGNTLNINGTDYEYEEPSAGEELKPIEAPEAKAPEEQKPEKSPETGDESNMAVPFAAAGLALAAMAAAVAARRRHN